MTAIYIEIKLTMEAKKYDFLSTNKLLKFTNNNAIDILPCGIISQQPEFF